MAKDKLDHQTHQKWVFRPFYHDSIGWVKTHWLVQLFTGEVVKVKLGNKTELESNVMAIVPAKLDDPNDPTSAFSLP